MGRATIIVRQMTENTSEKLTFGTPKYCVTGVMNMPKQVRIMAQGKNIMAMHDATMAYA